MRKFLASVVLLLLTIPTHAIASPDISGTWQAEQGTRYVLKIDKTATGGFRGDFYSLEEKGLTLNGNPMSVSVNGNVVSFSYDRSPGIFHGMLSADGKSIAGSWGATAMTFEKATKQTAWVIDPSPHTVRFITVDKSVKLEVLDWGGTGTPLVFLAGGGFTAHVYDTFAPKFTDKHHVYAITRRGSGVSSWPAPTAENYDPDRLGDDVLAVIDALKLDKPVLAGHSIAGEELSSIGTRHPEKVSGLIYLDAASAYAYYDPDGEKSIWLYAASIKRDVQQMVGAGPQESRMLVEDMQAMLPGLRQGLEKYKDMFEGATGPITPDALHPAQRSLRDQVTAAMQTNPRKYRDIKDPILAIFAQPKTCEPNCAPGRKAFEVEGAAQADAFEAGNSSARVVRLPNADHVVFRSNEADVKREMNAFMDGLSKP